MNTEVRFVVVKLDRDSRHSAWRACSATPHANGSPNVNQGCINQRISHLTSLWQSWEVAGMEMGLLHHQSSLVDCLIINTETPRSVHRGAVHKQKKGNPSSNQKNKQKSCCKSMSTKRGGILTSPACITCAPPPQATPSTASIRAAENAKNKRKINVMLEVKARPSCFTDACRARK